MNVVFVHESLLVPKSEGLHYNILADCQNSSHPCKGLVTGSWSNLSRENPLDPKKKTGPGENHNAQRTKKYYAMKRDKIILLLNIFYIKM